MGTVPQVTRGGGGLLKKYPAELWVLKKKIEIILRILERMIINISKYRVSSTDEKISAKMKI